MSDAVSLTSHNLEQTLAIGAAVARLAEPGDTVALVGELGAGKTQFVRGMARGMGIAPENVSSPTFVIMHEYAAETPSRDGVVASASRVPLLVHIDAYRLNNPEELADLALDDVRAEAVLAVEWADRVMPALGDDVLLVEMAHDAMGRRIRMTPRGRWLDKMTPLDV